MNGKGSSPRNCFSKQFKQNYDEINWSKPIKVGDEVSYKRCYYVDNKMQEVIFKGTVIEEVEGNSLYKIRLKDRLSVYFVDKKDIL